VLETPNRTEQIEGETVLSFSSQALKHEMPSFPALQQAGVHYRWDGEETFGMLERSNPFGQDLPGLVDRLQLRPSHLGDVIQTGVNLAVL